MKPIPVTIWAATRQAAAALEADGRHDPFIDGWSGLLEALAHLFGGRIERRVEICTEMAKREGFARVVGLCGLTWALPAIGLAEEARSVADETLAAARSYGNPFWIGWALGGTGRAFAETAPLVALGALREGLAYAEEHRLPFWKANLAQDAARLEATHGEFDDALHPFSNAIDAFHRAGNIAFLAATLASLAVFFDRFERPEIAATVYGAGTRQASIGLVPNLPVCRRPPPLGARRRPVRRVRRHRRRPVDRRRGPVRAPAAPPSPPRDR